MMKFSSQMLFKSGTELWHKVDSLAIKNSPKILSIYIFFSCKLFIELSTSSTTACPTTNSEQPRKSSVKNLNIISNFLQDVYKCFVFHNHLLKRHLQINSYSHVAPNHLKRSSSLKSHRRKCIVCTENQAKQPCFWCLQTSELNIPLLFCQMNIVLNCSSV